ncbi:hypothetical protein [Thalassomonas sp. RHCl1]|uniref:hypothetical protein n=1 Tax=Thalassomonas sp. RHCl1 TaxID=2995320 RepID=UPI00248C52AA|nr:hypothetical protein [Thalassomonas sp. RHCl1]
MTATWLPSSPLLSKLADCCEPLARVACSPLLMVCPLAVALPDVRSLVLPLAAILTVPVLALLLWLLLPLKFSCWFCAATLTLVPLRKERVKDKYQ